MPDRDYWQTYYEQGYTPWDLGDAHAALRPILELGVFGDNARILVPGAGNGHDALHIAANGHRVVAIDFAAQAIAHVRAEAERRTLDGDSLQLDVWQRDVFSLLEEPANSFDAVFEHTCFCAIDPPSRSQYRDVVTHLVKPGGTLVMIVFPLHRINDDGTPYPIDPDELRALFSPAWRELLYTEPRTVPAWRRGNERLSIWRHQ